MGKEPRNGPPLILDHMIFFSLIGDADFFKEVPAFFFMKEAAQQTHQEITSAIVSKERSCLGCSDVRTAIRPLFVAFVDNLRKLQEDSPEALKPFVEYITGKRGYRPVPITIYFKKQGKVQVLEF